MKFVLFLLSVFSFHLLALLPLQAAETPAKPFAVFDYILDLEVPKEGYKYTLDQMSELANREQFMVYVPVARENLASIFKHGFFKRIGASALFDQPAPIGLDGRKISTPIVLAFVVDKEMLQRPDDNGLGAALSPATRAKDLPTFNIYKTEDIVHYANEYREYFEQGRLGRLAPTAIHIAESIRATAHEFMRHDKSKYDLVESPLTDQLGSINWAHAVHMSKAIFLEALQRLKFHEFSCTAVLAHSTAVKEPKVIH